MVRRSFRIGLRMGVLAGLVAAVAKAVQSRRSPAPTPKPAPVPAAEPAAEWPPIQQDPPQPAAPEVPQVQAEADTLPPVRKAVAKKAPATKKAAPRTRTRKAAAPAAPAPEAPEAGGATAWVEPTGTVCPPSHPVKAKLSSKLFHLPGMFAYARTTPDRCYTDAEAAEADGLARAKR